MRIELCLTATSNQGAVVFQACLQGLFAGHSKQLVATFDRKPIKLLYFTQVIR